MSAPIPDNTDSRPPDILREQKEARQAHDPVAAAEEVAPPPPVVESPPPFPSVPSFSPPADEAMYEAAKTAVRDVFRQVRINGVSPEQSGLEIAFTLQDRPSVSDEFIRMNTPAPAEPTPPAPPVPQQSTVLEGSAAASAETGTRQSATVNRPGEGIDPMTSKRRLPGESNEERRERIKMAKDIKENDPSAVSAIASGDTTYFYKGMVPVLLTRGDTLRKIIGFIDQSFTGVVEGAASGERQSSLPAPGGYYIGGLPSGCPFDFYAQLEGTQQTTASFLATVKHTGCNQYGVGNKSFDRYAGVSAKESDAGYWAFFGQAADWNFKAIAQSDRASSQLFDSSSSVFAEMVVKSGESSVWGYSDNAGYNYSLKAKGSKADLELWSSGGATASMWAESSSGMKVVSSDGDDCYAEPGKLWVSYADGSNAQFYGGGCYIEGSDGTFVSIETSAASGHDLYIREIETCDGKMMVLCSDTY